MSTIIAVASIYLFILLGFIAKRVFKERIDEKTLILISIYCLQPFLTFWGLTRAPLDFNLIYTPFLYFIIITISLLILIIASKFLFDDAKDKSIFIAASLIGNTGNLGIPLGIALWGEMSVAYTSMINIANVFFIYTVGIYFYAKSQFAFKDALKEMVKIPILWFAIIALIFNYSQIEIHPQINQILQMGAYSSIVIQLIIFGIYLSKIEIKQINYKLNFLVSGVKLIVVPLIGILVLQYSSLPNELAAILMVSLIVPLAVNNVNMAALYNCKPLDVTSIVMVSTLIFLVLAYFDLEIIKGLFG